MKKNNVFEILDYMFEFLFAQSEQEETTEIDDITIKKYLKSEGFTSDNIEQALLYLTNVTNNKVNIELITTSNTDSIRIYTDEEKKRLGKKGCDLLTFLKNSKQLNTINCELIIAKLMNLPYIFNYQEIKWLANIVTLNENNHNLTTIIDEVNFDIDKEKIRH